jgi:hypothetical protein
MQENNGALLVAPSMVQAHFIPLPPGIIVGGGSWAHPYHNNQNIDEDARQNQTSLALCLDYCMCSKQYKFAAYEHIGFLNK